MEKWQNFYLQRMGSNPADNNAPYPVLESVSTWGMWCKNIPFKLFDKIKQPAKRTWLDEHGDDEYISSEGFYLEAYTIRVEFGCKLITDANDIAKYNISVDDVRQKVGQFLDFLRNSGEMKIYSSYTRIGRQKVRIDNVSDDAKWKSKDGQEYLTFNVTFKVNDPVTDITLTI